jgi:hypothetical protein
MNTTDRVIQDLQKRHTLGLQKYGTTIDGAKLNQRQLLQHAYEEALDFAVYIKRLLHDMDNYHAEQSEYEKQTAEDRWAGKGLPF